MDIADKEKTCHQLHCPCKILPDRLHTCRLSSPYLTDSTLQIEQYNLNSMPEMLGVLGACFVFLFCFCCLLCVCFVVVDDGDVLLCCLSFLKLSSFLFLKCGLREIISILNFYEK